MAARSAEAAPYLSKVAPAKQDVHMEDVHRAGGIMALLGQLDVAGLINRDYVTVHAPTMGAVLDHWDISRSNQESVRQFFKAAPGNVRTAVAFLQSKRYVDLDLEREHGVIRSAKHAFSKDGGLAVLSGNIAVDGCIVKTAGVDKAFWPSLVLRACLNRKTHQSRRFCRTRSKRVTWLSSAMRGQRVGRRCKRCCIRPAI
jgi:dihydroxy-acid dehydratase